MSKLTTKERKKLPKTEFAGPDRSYPVDTKARAANAKARATQQHDKGNLSKHSMLMIDARANAKLGKGNRRGG